MNGNAASGLSPSSATDRIALGITTMITGRTATLRIIRQGKLTAAAQASAVGALAAVAGDPRLDRPQERERLDAGDDDRHRGECAGDPEEGEERARVALVVEAEEGVGAEDDRVRRLELQRHENAGIEAPKAPVGPGQGSRDHARNSPSNRRFGIRSSSGSGRRLGVRGSRDHKRWFSAATGRRAGAGASTAITRPATGDTRVRLPGVVPSRAVRRVVCQRCEQPYEPERESRWSRTAATSSPRSRGVG